MTSHLTKHTTSMYVCFDSTLDETKNEDLVIDLSHIF